MEKTMQTYEPLMMEVIEFDEEDVITTSPASTTSPTTPPVLPPDNF